MQSLIDALVRHGYAVVFGWVLAEQIGLPLPAEPFLLASGGVAGTGRLSLPLILVAASVASLLADAIWYWIGRLAGARVIAWLCRITLEPDSCVRKTERAFGARGARSLIIAKFFVLEGAAFLAHVAQVVAFVDRQRASSDSSNRYARRRPGCVAFASRLSRAKGFGQRGVSGVSALAGPSAC
jgi:hypothetical protein